MSACFAKQTIEQVVIQCRQLGLDQIELPCGRYPGDPWGLRTILRERKRLGDLKSLLARNSIGVSAIAVHGNPVHPQKAIAKADDADVRHGIELAKALDCKVVVAFSGLPAGSPKGTEPNFVTAPWPPEMLAMTNYQWDEVVIPYWTQVNKHAINAGVKIAIESHPNMTVHNPVEVVCLHKSCGKNIGGNFDPSHWGWQGIDPIKVVGFWAANKCFFYMHAKDWRVRQAAMEFYGAMAPVSFTDGPNRPWVFCSVGVGHDASWWGQLMGELAIHGLGDISVSLEHEDASMSLTDGIEKALVVLKQVVIRDTKADTRWAK